MVWLASVGAHPSAIAASGALLLLHYGHCDARPLPAKSIGSQSTRRRMERLRLSASQVARHGQASQIDFRRSAAHAAEKPHGEPQTRDDLRARKDHWH